ncbi:putative mitochondrial protein [Vitis vinifera]|uniref:Putative mitochondrial protein n=1 Tax=Vitis vinifera TaxID=29760 RepID=A0A438K9R6_VITVI|nr:putative mitochondrial protein [Vitis vinifera]
MYKMLLRIPKWKETSFEEMRALEKNEMWEMVDPPRGKTIVGCKWVFAFKYRSDGSLQRFKVQLVAKGFT